MTDDFERYIEEVIADGGIDSFHDLVELATDPEGTVEHTESGLLLKLVSIEWGGLPGILDEAWLELLPPGKMLHWEDSKSIYNFRFVGQLLHEGTTESGVIYEAAKGGKKYFRPLTTNNTAYEPGNGFFDPKIVDGRLVPPFRSI